MMALATAPHTQPSTSVEDGARRLFEAGYLDRLQRSRPYIDGDGHPHYRWTIPSETTPGRTYVLDFDIADEGLTCTCPGFGHHRHCKHTTLLLEYRVKRARLVTEGGEPPAGLAARVAFLEHRVQELEQQARTLGALDSRIADTAEWLASVAEDMLTRTAAGEL
jgi:hypothetical protein